MKTYTTNRKGILHRLMSFLGTALIAILMVNAAAFSQQAPILESPADLATNQSTTVELKWFAAAGDSVYHLQIDTSIVFGTTFYDDSTLTSVSHIITGLRNATKYYWRVSVKDSANDGGGTSPYSTIRSFTTWNYTPTTPLLPVTLGSTGGFAILSYAGVTNTGPTSITGDVGVSPAAATYITGFSLILDASNTFSTSSLVTGKVYAADYAPPTPTNLTTAIGDLTIAYDDAAGRTVNPIGVSGNLGGRTLYSGLYKSTSSLEISSGDLTLDAQGDTTAVWVFQIASSFNMTSGRQVFLSGGAKASNIFWQVGSAATFGTTCTFKGTIMAYANITFATGASLEGRALAKTASVTLQGNTIGGVFVVTTVRTEYVPKEYALSQNYPNPFNPSTKIQYSLRNAGFVSLTVFNLLGREVATLVNGNQEAGSYTVPFNTNEGKLNLASGVYFYRLEAGSFVSTKKLILMK